jgi:hypothetical protein
MGDEGWFVAPIREPWYIALARAVPDPQVEHPLAAIQAVLDDYGLEVRPLSAEAGDTECPTCKGQGCEYGCGHCHESPSVAGPDAHRQCKTCHGTGLSAEAGDTDA